MIEINPLLTAVNELKFTIKLLPGTLNCTLTNKAEIHKQTVVSMSTNTTGFVRLIFQITLFMINEKIQDKMI
jgi:hypothetical protein